MMFNIGGFFKRIQNSVTKEILVRTAVREAIKKSVGVEVPIEKISIKGDTAIIDGISQSAKSVVYIKKQAILGDIALGQNLINIKDIR